MLGMREWAEPWGTVLSLSKVLQVHGVWHKTAAECRTFSDIGLSIKVG
jgi:hypothetical protein